VDIFYRTIGFYNLPSPDDQKTSTQLRSLGNSATLMANQWQPKLSYTIYFLFFGVKSMYVYQGVNNNLIQIKVHNLMLKLQGTSRRPIKHRNCLVTWFLFNITKWTAFITHLMHFKTSLNVTMSLSFNTKDYQQICLFF